MSTHSTETTYGIIDSPKNKKLISDLAAKGAPLLLFPPLETEKLIIPEAALPRLKNLEHYDWIILPDVLAADYLIEILNELEIDFFELDNSRVCACGEAVSDRLRFVQIHADVIPSKLDDENVFAAISQYAGGDLKGSRMLLVKELSSPARITEKLKNAAAKVDEIAVYRAVMTDLSGTLKLKTLLRGGAVDEFILSSPEDLLGLKFLFPKENPADFLAEIKVSALNEQIFQHLLENGLRPLYFHPK